jgi:hypothetical protein
MVGGHRRLPGLIAAFVNAKSTARRVFHRRAVLLFERKKSHFIKPKHGVNRSSILAGYSAGDEINGFARVAVRT